MPEQVSYPLEKCRPLENIPPPDGTFEVGVVMAGAISAGAYTAGVIDFLIEALDAWEKAKNTAKQGDATKAAIPSHDVKIKIITGASAGSIVGAITAAAIQYDFKHVNAVVSQDEESANTNPLYRAWVSEIDISKLLQLFDLDKSDKIVSLLDSTCLLEIAKNAIGYTGTPIKRPYLNNPLRMAFAVNNLRGVPYAIDMQGNVAGTGYDMAAHADNVRFAITGIGDGNAGATCPDETVLLPPNSFNSQEWMDMALASLASGAFPLFLSPRELVRENKSVYDFRYVALPGNTPPLWAQIKPTWPSGINDPYQYLCVDGGTMNNEPIELARTELAGLLGRNPRTGQKAKRATVLIDPFPDAPGLGSSTDNGIIKTALDLFQSWIAQSRFKPVDLALAHDETIYSRFIVSPSRGDSSVSNGYAIACGSLGGFGGFLHQKFRNHDYLLGRRNCQKFLRNHFTLPADNPLFDYWDSALKTDQRYQTINSVTGIVELPIIPLMDSLNPSCGLEESLPTWPQQAYTKQNLDTLKNQIEQRLDAIYDRVVKDMAWYTRLYLRIGWSISGRSTIVDGAIKAIEDSLRDRKLYP